MECYLIALVCSIYILNLILPFAKASPRDTDTGHSLIHDVAEFLNMGGFLVIQSPNSSFFWKYSGLWDKSLFI
jgi:hypothetical protein